MPPRAAAGTRSAWRVDDPENRNLMSVGVYSDVCPFPIPAPPAANWHEKARKIYKKNNDAFMNFTLSAWCPHDHPPD